MTFKTFEKIATTFKKNIKVYPHGECIHGGQYGVWDNPSMIMVTFLDSDKSYNYSGSYRQILYKLGIEYMTEEDFEQLEKSLAKAKEGHKSLFSKEPRIDEEEIKRIETEIARCKELPLLDKKGNVIKNSTTEEVVEEATEEPIEKVSEYVGAVGEKFNMTIENMTVLSAWTNRYNGCLTMTFLYSFKDVNGNEIIWKTSKDLTNLNCQNKVIAGTIKELKTFNGNKQTVVTRCRIK